LRGQRFLATGIVGRLDRALSPLVAALLASTRKTLGGAIQSGRMSL
jgi:hypothetical protein